MPFPVLRDSDESDSDFEGITEEKVAPKKPVAVFERLSAAVYDANQEEIKKALRGNVGQLYYRFPCKVTLEVQRFPAATDFKVFTLPQYDAKSSESVEFVYPVEEFPGGFIDMKDNSGRRWKCVAFWNGTSIQYISNIGAEIKLCGHLFAGTTKGGKVRWDKAVVPNNLIPGKFEKFCVSDKVLFDRRKSAWPEQLKQHQDACGIVVADQLLSEKKKDPLSTPVKAVIAELSDQPPPLPKKRKTALPMQKPPADGSPKPVFRKLDLASEDTVRGKRKAESYLEIKTSRLCTRISSDEKIQVEFVSVKDGNTTRTSLFCN